MTLTSKPRIKKGENGSASSVEKALDLRLRPKKTTKKTFVLPKKKKLKKGAAGAAILLKQRPSVNGLGKK